MQTKANIKSRPQPRNPKGILFHTKVYALSDRFNVTKLKDLAYSKITALFVECGMVADKSDMDAVMEAVTYAFGHLTLSVQKGPFSPDSLNSKEKLLVYMVRYMAWARDSFQKNEAFLHLLEECPEFAIALVFTSRSASAPPWSETVNDETERHIWQPLVSFRQRPRVLERSGHRMDGGGSYHATRNNRNTVHDLEIEEEGIDSDPFSAGVRYDDEVHLFTAPR